MLQVFCDFDGTLAADDVGNLMFRTFSGGKSEEIVALYRDNAITARECLKRECESVGVVQRDALREFVQARTLDPYAKEFVRFCRDEGLALTILSDGLDVYVKPILEAAGLSDVPCFANSGTLVEQDGGEIIIPSFPYRDEHCSLCGNCKRNHMLTRSAEDDVIVYVGDGISDRCPVRYADIVFAKKSLIGYCQEQNVSYFEFRHLGDVRDRLKQIMERGRIRQRREAAVARRDVFIGE